MDPHGAEREREREPPQNIERLWAFRCVLATSDLETSIPLIPLPGKSEWDRQGDTMQNVNKPYPYYTQKKW